MDAALDMGVDFIALSFVQTADDLVEAKKLINDRAKLISKIERPQAVANIHAIIDHSDAVMLARGDLGVEIPPERVPSVQKRVVELCRRAGKPLIIATQMLESMVVASAPTRAEVSDVATAIYDGADAVMLSAETAAGNYPVKSVQMMDRIARQVENDPHYQVSIRAEQPDPKPSTAGAITAACHQVADTINAAAIVNFTTSGSTALRTARHRPNVPIISLSSDRSTARQLVLSYGVHAVHSADVGDFFGVEEKAVSIATAENMAETGDKLVITAGVPFGTPGSTNILRVCEV
jgi:pyruvate kinase